MVGAPHWKSSGTDNNDNINNDEDEDNDRWKQIREPIAILITHPLTP